MCFETVREGRKQIEYRLIQARAWMAENFWSSTMGPGELSYKDGQFCRRFNFLQQMSENIEKSHM